MDQLWAPWRLTYIANPKPPGADDGCFLCRGLAEADDRANLIVYRGVHCAVFLNRFPYNNGHLLVAPNVHKGRLDELEGPGLTSPVETVRWVRRALDRMMRPQGYNVALTLGRSAGAGLPGHLHWHVVP